VVERLYGNSCRFAPLAVAAEDEKAILRVEHLRLAGGGLEAEGGPSPGGGRGLHLNG
jgi:hypothetical protein